MSATPNLPKLPDGWRWKIEAWGNSVVIKLQEKGWLFWYSFDKETFYPVSDNTVREEIERAAGKMHKNFRIKRAAKNYVGIYGG